MRIAASGLEALIDPTQLHQILWNLCENALRHGRAATGEADVELQLLRVARYGRVCLEVTDRGAGRGARRRGAHLRALLHAR